MTDPSSNNRLPSRKLLLAVIGVVILFAAVRWFDAGAWLQQAQDRIAGLGFWGPGLFILVYAMATVLFVPASVLTLGAGALFGVVKGSIYVSIASTAGATLAFLIGRHFARAAIKQRIEGSLRFSAIDRAVAAEGWKIVGLTRLSPVFPFALLNYAFGLTSISLWHYFIASWIGMIPGTVMYVYLGSLARAATGERVRTLAEWTFYGVGLLATVLVTLLVTRLARKALTGRIE